MTVALMPDTRETTPRRIDYPRDAILTPEEVCEALAIPASLLAKLDIPRLALSKRCTRYRWSTVLDYLKGREV